jgi:cell division protein FtsW
MSLCAIGVVLSLAREQMAPAIRPKRMLKFKGKAARPAASTKKTARKRP